MTCLSTSTKDEISKDILMLLWEEHSSRQFWWDWEV